MLTFFVFLAALAALVLSHEFGHFIAARKSGMKVEEFGFGFPPRVAKFKKGETMYSLNLIPIGGFVKILGENSDEIKDGSFSSKPIWKRAIVIAAGVCFNLLLAWFLYSGALSLGVPGVVGEDETGVVTLVEVARSSPAEKAGLKPGDAILKIISFEEDKTGEIVEVGNPSDVQDFVSRHGGEKIGIVILRGKKELSVSAELRPEPNQSKGVLGISMVKTAVKSVPLRDAFIEGAKTTYYTVVFVMTSLAVLVRDLILGTPGAADQVAGPVGIYSIIGDTAQMGFAFVVFLVANLSVVLAVMNFLPIPALDGGRIVLLAVEAIRGKSISQRVSNAINTAGFVFLMFLMLLVTYKDITRLVD